LCVSHNAASRDYLITATYIYRYFSTKRSIQALGGERVRDEAGNKNRRVGNFALTQLGNAERLRNISATVSPFANVNCPTAGYPASDSAISSIAAKSVTSARIRRVSFPFFSGSFSREDRCRSATRSDNSATEYETPL